MAAAERYDTIGIGYHGLRRPDPCIEAAVLRSLGRASTVLNVGAGAGSYEPVDRRVVAVEPAMMMIRQRPPEAAPVVRAVAGALPFSDHAFAAALALLTIHHWPDPERGLREMMRVAHERVVLLTWDPTAPGFWLADYFPEIVDVDRTIFPTLATLRRVLGPLNVVDVPIPHNCTDGFLGAYWRRPGAYLEGRVRAAISTFSRIRNVREALARLAADLETKAWDRRYGHLLSQTSLDLGYRLVTSRV